MSTPRREEDLNSIIMTVQRLSTMKGSDKVGLERVLDFLHGKSTKSMSPYYQYGFLDKAQRSWICLEGVFDADIQSCRHAWLDAHAYETLEQDVVSIHRMYEDSYDDDDDGEKGLIRKQQYHVQFKGTRRATLDCTCLVSEYHCPDSNDLLMIKRSIDMSREDTFKKPHAMHLHCEYMLLEEDKLDPFHKTRWTFGRCLELNGCHGSINNGKDQSKRCQRYCQRVTASVARTSCTA